MQFMHDQGRPVGTHTSYGSAGAATSPKATLNCLPKSWGFLCRICPGLMAKAFNHSFNWIRATFFSVYIHMVPLSTHRNCTSYLINWLKKLVLYYCNQHVPREWLPCLDKGKDVTQTVIPLGKLPNKHARYLTANFPTAFKMIQKPSFSFCNCKWDKAHFKDSSLDLFGNAGHTFLIAFWKYY